MPDTQNLVSGMERDAHSLLREFLPTPSVGLLKIVGRLNINSSARESFQVCMIPQTVGTGMSGRVNGKFLVFPFSPLPGTMKNCCLSRNEEKHDGCGGSGQNSVIKFD